MDSSLIVTQVAQFFLTSGLAWRIAKYYIEKEAKEPIQRLNEQIKARFDKDDKERQQFLKQIQELVLSIQSSSLNIGYLEKSIISNDSEIRDIKKSVNRLSERIAAIEKE